jgi:SOS-response transcriptional repressor LexA
MPSTLIATTEAEYLLVEAALPGELPETIGVLLHDAQNARLEFRLRRDWDQWMSEDDEEVFTHLGSEFSARLAALGPGEFLRRSEESFSHAVRLSERRKVLVDRFDRTLDRLYRQHVPARVQKFHTHLPVYSCRAAAGRWGEQMDVEAEGWREMPDGLRLTEDMFIAQVVGQSMEPLIPDGSYCIFRGGVTGSRQGRKVLVEDLSQSEQGGERYTVKTYTSKKSAPASSSDDGQWRHEQILLKPLNPAFDEWELTEGSPYRVIAEFVRVLE